MGRQRMGRQRMGGYFTAFLCTIILATVPTSSSVLRGNDPNAANKLQPTPSPHPVPTSLGSHEVSPSSIQLILDRLEKQEQQLHQLQEEISSMGKKPTGEVENWRVTDLESSVSNFQKELASLGAQVKTGFEKDDSLRRWESGINDKLEHKFQRLNVANNLDGDWKMVVNEDFSKGAFGWTNNNVSQCGPYPVLGGYCQFGGIEVGKSYRNITQHTRIRIKASIFFIDYWKANTAYVKLDHQVVWSRNAVTDNSTFNVCGNAGYSDQGPFQIEVEFPHSNNFVSLEFGSDLDVDACEASWALSNVQLYVCENCAVSGGAQPPHPPAETAQTLLKDDLHV